VVTISYCGDEAPLPFRVRGKKLRYTGEKHGAQATFQWVTAGGELVLFVIGKPHTATSSLKIMAGTCQLCEGDGQKPCR